MKKLLTSKPFPKELVADLKKKNIAVEYIPLIEITPQKYETININRYDLLIFTSVNAVKCTHEKISAKTLVASLSGQTAKEFEQKNRFSPQITAPNGEELALKILDSSAQKVLFLKGKMSLNTLQEKLAAKKIFQEIEVYNTKLLSPKIEKSYEYYVFFSPSSVESFMKGGNSISQKASIFAIGNTTKNALQAFVDTPVYVSKEPSISSLVELINRCTTTL